MRSIDDLAIMTGTVTAADVSVEAIWTNTTGKVDRETVTASSDWHRRCYDPIVPSGRSGADAVIYPCGKVLDRETYDEMK